MLVQCLDPGDDRKRGDLTQGRGAPAGQDVVAQVGAIVLLVRASSSSVSTQRAAHSATVVFASPGPATTAMSRSRKGRTRRRSRTRTPAAGQVGLGGELAVLGGGGTITALARWTVPVMSVRSLVSPEVDGDDVVVDGVRAEPLGLGAHPGHQVGPSMPVGKWGKFSTSVVGHQRPAGGDGPGEHQRRELGAGGVEGGGVPGRAGADDHDMAIGVTELSGVLAVLTRLFPRWRPGRGGSRRSGPRSGS